jgi:uncharacterized protein YqkB
MTSNKEIETMEITVTASAQNEIEAQLVKNDMHALKLVYDNEGCGCAVNGVAQVWMIPSIEASEASEAFPCATGSVFQIVFAQKDVIYFEERLIIDYKASGRSFILKSANQIYNNNLDLLVKGAMH